MLASLICGAILCATTILVPSAFAIDVTETGKEVINLTSKDIVDKSQLTPTLRDGKRPEYRFIGDLMIGERYPDEVIFQRLIEVSNPSDQVYSRALDLTVDRGVIHYLSVVNEKNSFAVVCDESYSLGTARTSFKVRVPPNTKSYLMLFVAAH